MPILAALPLTLLPFAAFNLAAFGFLGSSAGDPWAMPVISISLVSGAGFTLLIGDLMIVAGLIFLFIEILKATRIGTASLVDHILSTLVLIAYLVEFLAIPEAAHSVFFILTVIALIDVIAGFSITITGSRRDVAFGNSDLHH
ncbi:hypothetical protein H2509_16120 [Stappia sp. F7233]|uniref:Uncharacterized protein n=1 Tax=Stappia albiluteola TaxID=2758565 RepID=A0A839AIR9_9HYPH|nr:hypothetical protein [Stappia albiluteola]MBA5778657.1 hypothetical protein [Stappia albiluteola]